MTGDASSSGFAISSCLPMTMKGIPINFQINAGNGKFGDKLGNLFVV